MDTEVMDLLCLWTLELWTSCVYGHWIYGPRLVSMDLGQIPNRAVDRGANAPTTKPHSEPTVGAGAGGCV